jgi:hypothetical protein
MLDRLKLDDKRIASMAKGLREVVALPDPVGRLLDDRTRPNGLRLQRLPLPSVSSSSFTNPARTSQRTPPVSVSNPATPPSSVAAKKRSFPIKSLPKP